ncbi:universal stress protein [Halapricum sp. CBA1109]|uniref:universal stress protein n=1 Tax=Halapricum sp. CBA1109 TaxID=2668068 RepID=UPI0012F83909|nr:universal stress protein [Halapricum sp. CBA1109]MUV90658.1 universal stress protein [Halapricum sp. CBA1109]
MSVEIETILVPVDGTPAASRAVEYAVAVAAAYGAEIHVLHLVEEDPREDPDLVPSEIATEQAEFLAAATGGLQAVEDGTVYVTASTAAGFSQRSLARSPVSVVLDAATDISADLIVVPRESVREDPTALLAKAAEHVLSHASQPVLSV